jgi:hypothetical protein
LQPAEVFASFKQASFCSLILLRLFAGDRTGAATRALMFLFDVAGALLLALCCSLPSDVICWGLLLFACSCRRGQSSPKTPNLVENFSNRLADCNNSERYLQQWHGIGLNNTTSNLAVSLAVITVDLPTPVTASDICNNGMEVVFNNTPSNLAEPLRRHSLGER